MRQQKDMRIRPVEISIYIYICIIPAFQLLWQQNPSQNRLWECREFFGGVGLPNSFLHVTNSHVGVHPMGFVLGFAWPTWRGWRCSHGGQTRDPKIWVSKIKRQGFMSWLPWLKMIVLTMILKHHWSIVSTTLFFSSFWSFSGVLLSERKHVIFPLERFIWELHI